MNDLKIYPKELLLERLSSQNHRRIVFVIGSALSIPMPPETRGVPGATEIVEIVRTELTRSKDWLAKTDNQYQQAFDELDAARGRDAINKIVRKAVLRARFGDDSEIAVESILKGKTDIFMQLEADDKKWALTPGLEALGQILAKFRDKFSTRVLTSNFDPLIEISIRRYGALCATIACDQDLSLEAYHSPDYQVIHFHGYWGLRSTLHTPNELHHYRPQLLNSFRKILSEETVVVLGYGGWHDMFTRAMLEVLEDTTRIPDILWCFRSESNDDIARQLIVKQILEAHGPVTSVHFYYDIDVHTFLPRLLQHLNQTLLKAPRTGVSYEPHALAFDLSDSQLPVPANLGMLWGVDRGSFIGILSGKHDSNVFSMLQQIEGHISQLAKGGLVIRRWIKIDIGSDLAGDEALLSVTNNALTSTGLFIETWSPTDASFLRFLELAQASVEAGQLAIVVHLATEDFLAVSQFTNKLADRFRIASAPVDYLGLPVLLRVSGLLNQFYELYTHPGATAHNLSYDDFAIAEIITARLKLEKPTLDLSRTSLAMKAVYHYVTGQITEERFLKEYGTPEFHRALRAGAEFPNAINLIFSSTELTFDAWWLFRRLVPTRHRLAQILALPAIYRAVFGLVTYSEWNALGQFERERVLLWRESRPLCLPAKSINSLGVIA